MKLLYIKLIKVSLFFQGGTQITTNIKFYSNKITNLALNFTHTHTRTHTQNLEPENLQVPDYYLYKYINIIFNERSAN